jgi:hypothetical protein
MPHHALLVHGYSERSLSAYGGFPNALAGTAPELADDIVLSAFESLDDGVTIDDLADGLELQVRGLEHRRPGWSTRDAVFIAHSTGALVTRRWILNRLGTKADVPTHFITMAGANQGSTLAQMGRTPLGFAHQFLLKRTPGVGARVLIDLDYGSDFLLKLNREWLEWRFGDRSKDDDRLATMFVFSMGGDSLGPEKAVRLLWASSERGCDNTVRLSGANLNYNFLLADPEQKGEGSQPLRALPRGRDPHIVIAGRSHYGDVDGILASNKTKEDPPMRRIREALDVKDPAQYAKVRDDWQAAMEAWAASPAVNDRGDSELDPATNPKAATLTNRDIHLNSTIVFNVHDRGGRSVEDCFIGLMDADMPGVDADTPEIPKNILVEALLRVGSTLEHHSPIHNDVQRGSYSFYVNTDKFNTMHHRITIQAAAPGDCVPYEPIDYERPREDDRMVLPNEFTYVDITIGRDPSAAYALYARGERPENEPAWRPFPDQGRLDVASP